MKRIFALLLIVIVFTSGKVAYAQLGQATGDEFTVLVFHDIHTENSPGTFHNSVDWLVGANGRGPTGVSGITYYNIKDISGVGDYVTTCSDTTWGVNPSPLVNTFLYDWNRIIATGVPGIWIQGNHDACPQYTNTFGSTLKNVTLDVSTTIGTVKLGVVGVGVADDMRTGQPSRTYVDNTIAGSDAVRQWIFLRHLGPSEGYGDNTPRLTPPSGDPAVWTDPTSGNSGVTSSLALLNNFFYPIQRVFWFVTGHFNYGAAIIQVTANDGHLITGIGNNGNDGYEGHVTMFKFQPSLHQFKIAHYVIGQAGTLGGTLVGPVITSAWNPQTSTTTKLFPLPSPVGSN